MSTLTTEEIHKNLFIYQDKFYFEAEFVKNVINTMLEMKKERQSEEFVDYVAHLIDEVNNFLDAEESDDVVKTQAPTTQIEWEGNIIECEGSSFLSRLYNEFGIALMFLEKFEEAQESFESSKECNPENLNSLYNLADLAFMTKQFEKAIEYSNEILAISPSHVGAIYLIGLSHSCAGNPEEALPFFQKTVEIEPDSIGGNYWSGECLLYKQEFEKALPYFKKNADNNTGNADSLRGLAICYLGVNKANECLEICDELLKVESTNRFMVFQIKGDAYVQLQDFVNAGTYHAELALIELDARDIISNKVHYIADTYGKDNARIYAGRVLEFIPDMMASFDFLDDVKIPNFKDVQK